MTLPQGGHAGCCVSSSSSAFFGKDELSSGNGPAPVIPPVSAPVPAPERECELKLEGDAEALERAFGSIPRPGNQAAAARTLTSVYFDTPGGALWSKGYVLRVRKSQGRYLQTLKWPEPDASLPDTRREIEARCAGEAPDAELFGKDYAERIEFLTGGAPLVPRFTTVIKRRIVTFELHGAKIEAAFDSGHILDGDRTVTVREIELELKDGDAAGLYEFAEQLSTAYNLRLGVLTKSQRGFLLAAGEKAEVRRAIMPKLDRDMRLDDLIGPVLGECLDHFVLNWPVLLQADNADGIHQMRVGIRRLRALLRIFHREIPNSKLHAFRADARDIASALGQARETDVFRSMLEEGPFAGLAEDAGRAAFLQAVNERRDEGYGYAHAMLAAPQTTRFVLDLRAFIARKGWHAGLTSEQLINLGEPAAKFAQRALERMDRKARKQGKMFEDLSGDARHDLRILLKNIRYGAENFGSLFDHEAGRRKYLKSVAHLQEQLGLANDALVADAIIADVERRAGAISARAAGMVAGWTARGLVDGRHSLAADFHHFRKARRFWR